MLNSEAIKKRLQEVESGIRGELQLKEGENIIRVLPRSMKYFDANGDVDIAYSVKIHFGLRDIDGKRFVVCRQTINEACPICQLVNDLSRGNETDKNVASRIQAGDTFYMNVSDRSSDLLKPTVVLLRAGWQIYSSILKIVASSRWGDVLDFEKGRDLIIVKEIKKGANRPSYTVYPDQAPSSIADSLPKTWKEDIDRLAGVLPKPRSYEELSKLVVVQFPGMTEAESVITQSSVDSAQATSAPPQSVAEEAKPVLSVAPVSSVLSGDTRGSLPCFGVEFSVRKDVCKNCPQKTQCRDAFLSGL